MKELVSVIIPVYNVENYLERCVNSVIEQTYKNLEIILVNDGSTDNSGVICDELKEKDERIIVIHQNNKGLSGARNSALDICNGDYITCIDSDDWINPDCISILYDAIKEKNADVAICGYSKVYENGKKINCTFGSEKEYSGIDAVKSMLYQKDVLPSAWGKLYKKDMFMGIRYPEGVLFEDLPVTYEILRKSDKVVCIPYIGYLYLQRKGSIIYTKFNPKKAIRIEIIENIMKKADKNSEYINAIYARFLIANMQVLREIDDQKLYVKLVDSIEKNVKSIRKYVLKDRDAKLETRIIALVSYISIKKLAKLGEIYKKIHP